MGRPAFSKWLVAQANRWDRVGDLARDVIADLGEAPDDMGPSELRGRISSIAGTSDKAFMSLRQAVGEWRDAQ